MIYLLTKPSRLLLFRRGINIIFDYLRLAVVWWLKFDSIFQRRWFRIQPHKVTLWQKKLTNVFNILKSVVKCMLILLHILNSIYN